MKSQFYSNTHTHIQIFLYGLTSWTRISEVRRIYNRLADGWWGQLERAYSCTKVAGRLTTEINNDFTVLHFDFNPRSPPHTGAWFNVLFLHAQYLPGIHTYAHILMFCSDLYLYEWVCNCDEILTGKKGTLVWIDCVYIPSLISMFFKPVLNPQNVSATFYIIHPDFSKLRNEEVFFQVPPNVSQLTHDYETKSYHIPQFTHFSR